MFQVDLKAAGGPRLTSTAKLTPEAFADAGRRMGAMPFAAQKSGLISAIAARRDERIVTRWNGQETVNTARPGDHIVTNLDARGRPLVDRDGNHNVYVIKADAFNMLYELADTPGIVVATYRARGTVQALALPGGFDILAPWGETQRADCGYLILNGADVYGNNAETFDATYERVAG
jgi:hypothetical protein